jgi:hypothetical protein
MYAKTRPFLFCLVPLHILLALRTAADALPNATGIMSPGRKMKVVAGRGKMAHLRTMIPHDAFREGKGSESMSTNFGITTTESVSQK